MNSCSADLDKRSPVEGNNSPRALGVAALEDSVPQRAVIEALNAIYGAPPALAGGGARGPDSGPSGDHATAWLHHPGVRGPGGSLWPVPL
jgi:hypothetical protein